MKYRVSIDVIKAYNIEVDADSSEDARNKVFAMQTTEVEEQGNQGICEFGSGTHVDIVKEELKGELSKVEEVRNTFYVAGLRQLSMILEIEKPELREVFFPGGDNDTPNEIVEILGGTNPDSGRTLDVSKLLYYIADMMKK